MVTVEVIRRRRKVAVVAAMVMGDGGGKPGYTAARVHSLHEEKKGWRGAEGGEGGHDPVTDSETTVRWPLALHS